MQFVIGISKNPELAFMNDWTRSKAFDYDIICLIGFVEIPNFVKFWMGHKH